LVTTEPDGLRVEQEAIAWYDEHLKKAKP